MILRKDLRSPPVGLALDVPQNNILNSRRHTRNLPRDIRFPTPPSLRQMLKDRLRLILLDRLGHHVQNIVHDSSTELQIIMRLNTLLRHRLRDTLAITTFELTSEQVPKPSLEQRNDTTHEEQPDAPPGCPEADTRALSDRSSVEAVVDEMLQVLRHTDLPHELVLVTVHSREGTDVGEGVLQSVGELEGVDVAKTVLDVGIDDELGEAEDFTTQVECVSES